MTSRRNPANRKEYERIGEKAARGEYELVTPLDQMILDELPDEGELVMGFYPMARTVSELRKGKFSQLPSVKVSARLVSLAAQGLCKNVLMSGERGWQRTPRGKAVVDDWKKGEASE